jgi:hypothetical protein
MRRDRTVVDDASVLRLLFLHHAKACCAQKRRPGQIDCAAVRPLLIGQVFERYPASARPGIVEQQVDAAVSLLLIQVYADFFS